MSYYVWHVHNFIAKWYLQLGYTKTNFLLNLNHDGKYFVKWAPILNKCNNLTTEITQIGLFLVYWTTPFEKYFSKPASITFVIHILWYARDQWFQSILQQYVKCDSFHLYLLHVLIVLIGKAVELLYNTIIAWYTYEMAMRNVRHGSRLLFTKQ